MDYRTGVRLVRALADGEAAFVFAAERSPDFDREAFAAFARAHNVREWLTPLSAFPPARDVLGAEFVRVLEERAAALPAEKRALLDLTRDIEAQYRSRGIPCVFFKGLYLGARFYGDVHRRHQYDLDVLVHPSDFEAALAALGPLGFDPRITASGKPSDLRLEKMRSRDAHHAPQTVTLRRADRLQVDLHCRLKGRLFHGLEEGAVWHERQTVEVGGVVFETLSDERALAHLLVSIAADLRRSACRAKHFLDLYQMLGALEDALDWETFFAQRAAERTERVAVNVLAIFLTLWKVADEFPALAGALERRLALVELLGEEEALAVVTRPRRSRGNRLWFVRMRAGGSPWLWRGLRASVDLPRALRRRSGAPWRSGEGADPGAAALPPPLRALLARERLRVREVREVTTLPGSHSPRASYRIALEGGCVLKGRVLPGRDRLDWMRRWNRKLPRAHFPPLLASQGVATLEGWAEGAACEKSDEATLEAAGAILGELHAALPREPLAADAEPLARWQRDVASWLEALRARGYLTAARAEAVLARARSLRPERGTFGLQHGDFCRENLVRGDAGLVCVDNPTVRPDVQESDLGQTFYRWPMHPGGREAFLFGYRRHADPAHFVADEDYWMIATALRAAAFRLREGTDAVETPLALLDRHVG